MLAHGARCSVGDQLHPSGAMDESTYRIIGTAYAEVEANPRVRLRYHTVAIGHADEAAIDVVGELLSDPNMLLGLADSGAHVGQICDTSFSTFFLRYWIGERKLMTFEEGIRKLTSDPAGFLGLAYAGRRRRRIPHQANGACERRTSRRPFRPQDRRSSSSK